MNDNTKKMNDNTMNRVDLLGGLIDQILVHDINFEISTNSLKKGNGLTTYCNYGSKEQLKKYRHIFTLCFHIDDPKNKHCFPEDQFGLSKESIIQKALSYFSDRGIDFKSQIKSVCKDEQEFENAILYAINDFLIPAAFHPLVNKTDSGDALSFDKFDNIYSYYEDAIRRIKIILIKFRSLRMLQNSEPVCEIIDSVYKNRDLCNYIVPLRISDLDLPYVPKWEPDIVFIPQKPIAIPQHSIDNLNKIEQMTEFDKMVEGFIPLLSNNNDPPLAIKDIVFQSDSDPIRYLLSEDKDKVYYSQLYPEEYHYITHLDEESIIKEYPDVSTHEELKKAIAKKASKDIKDSFENRIKGAYENRAHYIEEVLEKLMKCDLNELINMNPTNKEKCDNALCSFNLPADEIYKVIEDYEKEQSAVLLRVYHSLQGGLSLFLRNLKFVGLHFALIFNDYLDDKALTEHKKIVDRFITSSNLSDVVAAQKNKPDDITKQHEQEKTLEQSMISIMEINEHNHRYNDLFIKLKEVLSEYYEQLQHPDPNRDPFREIDFTNSYFHDPDFPAEIMSAFPDFFKKIFRRSSS